MILVFLKCAARDTIFNKSNFPWPFHYQLEEIQIKFNNLIVFWYKIWIKGLLKMYFNCIIQGLKCLGNYSSSIFITKQFLKVDWPWFVSAIVVSGLLLAENDRVTLILSFNWFISFIVVFSERWRDIGRDQRSAGPQLILGSWAFYFLYPTGFPQNILDIIVVQHIIIITDIIIIHKTLLLSSPSPSPKSQIQVNTHCIY